MTSFPSVVAMPCAPPGCTPAAVGWGAWQTPLGLGGSDHPERFSVTGPERRRRPTAHGLAGGGRTLGPPRPCSPFRSCGARTQAWPASPPGGVTPQTPRDAPGPSALRHPAASDAGGTVGPSPLRAGTACLPALQAGPWRNGGVFVSRTWSCLPTSFLSPVRKRFWWRTSRQMFTAPAGAFEFLLPPRVGFVPPPGEIARVVALFSFDGALAIGAPAPTAEPEPPQSSAPRPRLLPCLPSASSRLVPSHRSESQLRSVPSVVVSQKQGGAAASVLGARAVCTRSGNAPCCTWTPRRVQDPKGLCWPPVCVSVCVPRGAVSAAGTRPREQTRSHRNAGPSPGLREAGSRGLVHVPPSLSVWCPRAQRSGQAAGKDAARQPG